MNIFTRLANDSFYAVFEENGKFKIGLYLDGQQFSHDPEPYSTYDTEFSSRELAENVCKILSEEFQDGVNEGQVGCY
ncbi:hypothetical protein [Peribacillus asahii]|uniref:hypothetical protein n=1 Tax=Peribacillus asahii TaxID=228899 RepID=UPI0037F23AD4